VPHLLSALAEVQLYPKRKRGNAAISTRCTSASRFSLLGSRRKMILVNPK
jgi:hypothetical protein